MALILRDTEYVFCTPLAVCQPVSKERNCKQGEFNVIKNKVGLITGLGTEWHDHART